MPEPQRFEAVQVAQASNLLELVAAGVDPLPVDRMFEAVEALDAGAVRRQPAQA